jgi:DNA-directed RNA polymerase specialized sigma24 family protein
VDPEDEAIRRSSARDLDVAMRSLTPDARRALVLAAEGFSGIEIASRLERSPEAVRTLICRARARLRQLLDSERTPVPARQTV